MWVLSEGGRARSDQLDGWRRHRPPGFPEGMNEPGERRQMFSLDMLSLRLGGPPGDPQVSPRLLNLPLRFPGTMKSVAQDEVGSQEGPEGACDLGWAVWKRRKLEGGACQGPGTSLLAQEVLARASSGRRTQSAVRLASPGQLGLGTAFPGRVSLVPLTASAEPLRVRASGATGTHSCRVVLSTQGLAGGSDVALLSLSPSSSLDPFGTRKHSLCCVTRPPFAG